MAIGINHLVKAAFKKETNTTYGGAVVECGAGNQKPVKSENITTNDIRAIDVRMRGLGGKPISDRTGIFHSGDITFQAKYDGLLDIICFALGFSHLSQSPQNPTGSVYTHLFEVDNQIVTEPAKEEEEVSASTTKIRRGTLCFDKQAGSNPIWEYLSTMFSSITIRGDKDGIEVITTANVHSLDYNSTTNTSSASWTEPSNNENLVLKNATLRIRPRDEFTINSSNDSLTMDEGGVKKTPIDIPDGTYSGNRLAQIIQTKLNSDGGGQTDYVVTYDESVRKFTFTTTAGSTNLSIDVDDDNEISDTIGFSSDPSQSTIISSNVGARINDYTLDSGDEVAFSEFEITFERNQRLEEQTNASGTAQIEPNEAGKFNVTGSFTLPTYTSDTFLRNIEPDTTYFADLKFQGSLISGSEYYEFNIFLPAFKFVDIDVPLAEEGVMTETINFEAFEPEIEPLNSYDIESFLNSEYLDSAQDNINQLFAYGGSLYGCCGTGATAQVIKITDGTLSDTFKDLSVNEVWCACFDPTVNKIYFGADGSGTPGGDAKIISYDPSNGTWTTVKTISGGESVRNILYDPTDEYMYASISFISGGSAEPDIYRCDASANDTNWTIVFDASAEVTIDGANGGDYGTHIRAFNFGGTDYIYAFVIMDAGGELFRSSDSGANWTSLNRWNSNEFTACFHIGIVKWEGRLWIAAMTGGSQGVLYYSEDEGLTWTKHSERIDSTFYKSAIVWRGNLIIGNTDDNAANGGDGKIYCLNGINDTAFELYDAGQSYYEFTEYNNMLLMGTRTNGKILVRRPYRPIMIEIQNQESSNPLS